MKFHMTRLIFLCGFSFLVVWLAGGGRRQPSWAGLKLWVLVVALLAPISVGAAGEVPPETQTYKLPTMLDDGADYHERPAPLVEAPVIDAEAVFDRVTACYPAVSKFKIDLNLKGMLASSDMATLEDNTSYLGKSYVGLVASMPL